MRNVLFVHSAGPQGSNQGSTGFVANIKKELQGDFQVIAPDFPEPENPRFDEWKEQLESSLDKLNEEIILIGHSLGGSVLVKYFSEEECRLPVRAIFSVAAPYWGKDDDWQKRDFQLSQDIDLTAKRWPELYFYHAKMDPIVPFHHVNLYEASFPEATVHPLEGDSHLFEEGIPSLVKDIKAL